MKQTVEESWLDSEEQDVLDKEDNSNNAAPAPVGPPTVVSVHDEY